MKLQDWPDDQAVPHWRDKLANFQAEAQPRVLPSMRQRMDLDRLYARARRQLADVAYDDKAPQPWPPACPFTLDQLLQSSRRELDSAMTLSA